MNRRTPYTKKTILVTGGAGYIGSEVNKRLHQHGYQTVVFDNLSHGNAKCVPYGTFIKGNINNSSDLESIFQKHSFDGIMHFAALTDVGESTVNPLIYYQNNVSHTLNLLNAAIKYNVKAFVFSSSAAIFGIPQTEMISEDHPCHPINPYGQTKLMVEKILQNFDTAYGLKSCCLRYFNAAGADPEGEIRWYPRKENNLIPLLLKSLQNPSKIVTLFGSDYPTPDGTCIRDYIHVYDLAEAHILGLEQLFSTSISSAYNLGNGKGFSVREVVEAVEKVTQQQLKVIQGPRRTGDPAILVANANKALCELHWKPRYSSLEEMIAHAHQAITSASKHSSFKA